MNSPDRCETAGKPLALDLLLTEDQRRTITVDELVADPLIERHANRRSEKQTSRLLGILDELERSGK